MGLKVCNEMILLLGRHGRDLAYVTIDCALMLIGKKA